MKKIMVIVFCIFYNSLVIAHQDSLPLFLNQLDTATGKSRADILHKTGVYYGIKGEFNRALPYFQQSLDQSLKLNYEKGLVNAYTAIGLHYFNNFNSEKALDAFLKSLAIGKKLGLEKENANVQWSMANIYSEESDYKNALLYFNYAKEAFEKLKDTTSIAGVINDMGQYYDNTDDQVSAMKYYTDSYVLLRQFEKNNPDKKDEGFTKRRVQVISDYASYLQYTGKPEMSLSVLTPLWVSIENSGNDNNKLIVLRVLSYAHRVARKFDSVFYYTKKAMDIIGKDTTEKKWDFKKDFYWNNAMTYEDMKNYKAAYENYQVYKDYYDSMFSQQKSYAIADIQIEYETQKKDEQIIQLSKEKKSQQTITGLTIGMALIALGLLSLAYRSRRLKEKLVLQKQEADKILLEKKATSVELLALRAQINPHFIFNSLNSVSNYILKADTANANLYLNKFSTLMRKILQHSKSTQINLPDEVILLKQYLELEKLRFGNRMEYTISIPDALLEEDIRIPSMVIQPYLENAVKHGISYNTGKQGLLSVDFQLAGNKLLCTIDDNGPGINATQQDTNTNPDHHSLGANITQNRIDLINSMQEEKIQIEITDKKELDINNSGTRVKIWFPVGG